MDNILFWGGIALAGCALAAGGICFLVFVSRRARLRTLLNSEYGEKKSREKRK